MNEDNKTLIVIIIAIGLIVFGCFTLFKKISNNNLFNFNWIMDLKEEKEVSLQEVNQISLNLISTDIDIEENSDNKIKLEYYSNDDNNPTIEFIDNTLSIDEKESLEPCIGICNLRRRVVIYIPKEYIKPIDIITASGDINSSITLQNTKISTVSGDINLVEANGLDIKTTSGDIDINNVNDYINIVTTSGDIHFDYFKANKESSIRTTSGDVTINKCYNYVDSNTTSGDTYVTNNDLDTTKALKIKTTSGDIIVN